MSYIDYDNEGSDKGKLTHTKLCKYWQQLYFDAHKGVVLWNRKEDTLLSKLMKTLELSDIADCMQLWHETEKPEKSHNFGLFYAQIPYLIGVIRKDREWTWS